MSKGSFIPRYQMIYNELKAKIQSGDYASGSQLPFERELCESFGVQRITVRKALDLLVQDGLIHKRPGLGSFVSESTCAEAEPSFAGSLLFVMNKSQNDLHNNSSAYNAQLFFLMEQLCREAGYILLYTGISNNSEIRALMEQHHVIGAFLVSTVEQPIVDAFMQTELPLLCLNHSDPRILSVLPDNQTGIAKAVSHLAAHGHRRIAFIGGPPVSHNANERLQAFIFSMNDQGLPLCPDLVFRGDWTYEGSQRIISQMFASLPRSNWPSAIIAASDMMAIGATEAIHQNGLSVPRDISVIGFDNIDLCKLCFPQLTSVGPDARRMANIAVELMTTMLQRGSSSLQGCTVRIPVAFIERCSVGSAGVLDPSAPVSAKEQSSAS